MRYSSGTLMANWLDWSSKISADHPLIWDIRPFQGWMPDEFKHKTIVIFHDWQGKPGRFVTPSEGNQLINNCIAGRLTTITQEWQDSRGWHEKTDIMLVDDYIVATQWDNKIT